MPWSLSAYAICAPAPHGYGGSGGPDAAGLSAQFCSALRWSTGYCATVASAEVTWAFHLRAKREPNARRVLQRAIAAIGLPAKQQSVERYWKFPEQYVAVFTTLLDTPTAPEATFRTMLLAQKIGTGWSLLGPTMFDNETWTFELVCAANTGGRFRVPGVEWAHVSLQTHRNRTGVGGDHASDAP